MTSPTPSADSSKAIGVRDFDTLCALIPEDAYWGMPLTPDLVRHILASVNGAKAVGEPIGWKLVPVELTDEMRKAANEHDQSMLQPTWASTYRAMLDAAPTPSTQAVPQPST